MSMPLGPNFGETSLGYVWFYFERCILFWSRENSLKVFSHGLLLIFSGRRALFYPTSVSKLKPLSLSLILIFNEVGSGDRDHS